MHTPDIHDLYERSVQTPDVHVQFFERIYLETHPLASAPLRLREDFCGTHRISSSWVKSHPKRTALGLDLDSEVLKYGKAHPQTTLTSDEKKRLLILNQDVRSRTTPAVDIVAACNFSFCIFRERAQMLDYAKKVLSSLRERGLFILELAGGPGMIEPVKERRKIKADGKRPSFTYIWDQKSFDPITHRAHYSIHFKLEDGTLLKDAFTYDWRLWSLPELRDILEEAGFGRTLVYWELRDDDDELTGEYRPSDSGTNDHAWVAYLVGVRVR